MDEILRDQALVERFEPYFRHFEREHHALGMGDRAAACTNVKRALAALGFARRFGDDPRLFDEELSTAVRKFQDATGHRTRDGCVGPGTRSRLVLALVEGFGASWFADLDGSEVTRMPTVFLSYAWSDASRVNKVDQWLRDNGVRVIRDTSSFAAGSNIKDSIWKSILSADKVIAVYSQLSKERDWPQFEQQIAEQVEILLKNPLLIYLRLDDTPLKAHDLHRIAIEAAGKPLRQIGLEILKTLNVPHNSVRYDYNEEEPI